MFTSFSTRWDPHPKISGKPVDRHSARTIRSHLFKSFQRFSSQLDCFGSSATGTPKSMIVAQPGSISASRLLFHCKPLQLPKPHHRFLWARDHLINDASSKLAIAKPTAVAHYDPQLCELSRLCIEEKLPHPLPKNTLVYGLYRNEWALARVDAASRAH